ncbi:CGNR zinc finger domain-containing protein [Nocardiopsis changdeensis]|uniref:CGNR zinc finger domain-containing protein n=1 Tax=Nocardiopsis changdeensis TaxID=2831969 RepID=UPI003F46CEFF
MPTSTALTGRSVRTVAARTADLVNALAAPDTDPARVEEVLRAHGEDDPVTGRDLAALREAAARIRGVLEAGTTAAAAAKVNALLAAAHPPRLTDHGGASHWHVHTDSRDDAPLAEWFAASAGLMLALLLTDRQRPPGGVCGAEGCGRVFIDTGSGSARRFCSKRCATRSRVRAHRARA